jgi:hypothetical protein
MPNLYKAKLAALGLTQTSMLPEIRARTGIPVNNTELSAAINGVGKQKKHERILQALNEILKEYDGGEVVT